MGRKLVLALDQGTTSTRALLFDEHAKLVAQHAEPLRQIYPHPGWVEHDPDEIWRASVAVCREVLAQVDAGQVAALGIANQRETAVLWDRRTGASIDNAIVWQDRRTSDMCDRLRARGLQDHVRARTGLVVDPYFSATKIAWMLKPDPELRGRAGQGEIAFGTVDSWLIWKLTGGRVHATDETNASRTMLYDIDAGAWDNGLLEALDIPPSILPDVRATQGDFGVTDMALFGAPIPIMAAAGDQQAAAYGQCCFAPGQMKATFGTGCFVLANCGPASPRSAHGMLTTILNRIGGERRYAMEGAIFMAGATIQWLRDTLGLIGTAAESETLARAASENSGVVLVPAFQGLGAAHWDASARAAILGLTRASSRADIVRAGLESVAFQTRDLFGAMGADLDAAGLPRPASLRADGGMTENGWLMQFLADMLRIPVEIAPQGEATALGAAFHAGQVAGIYPPAEQLAKAWRAAHVYEPEMSESESGDRHALWLNAIARVRGHQP